MHLALRLTIFLVLISSCSAGEKKVERQVRVKLDPPVVSTPTTLEQALSMRRSVRSYESSPLTFAEVSKILWAAQGITGSRGRRTAPSAGASYPLECYLVVGDVESLASGVYHYLPKETAVVRLREGDFRARLSAASLLQSSIVSAPATLVIAANMSRLAARYLNWTRRFVYIEVGHCAQNVALECEALGLGSVCIGAFRAGAVRKLLGIREEVTYIMPIGRKEK